jgi:ABC-type polysaccharide/polyol phosphate export permease
MVMASSTTAKMAASKTTTATGKTGKQVMRSDRPLSEVLASLRNWRFWITLAWTDIRGRYRRTLLGPFWTALNSSLFIVILALVYSRLWNVQLTEFLPYLAAGFFVWGFFTSNTGESCQAMHGNGEALRSTIVTPISMLFRVIARNFIVFLHNLVVLIAVLLFFGRPVGPTMLLALPGLLLLSIFCLGLGTFLSILCARFRDVEQMVGTTLMILFFITPILWRPELLSADSRYLADWNPIFHLISVARDPLLNLPPNPFSLMVAAGLAAFALLCGLAAYAKFRGRLAYWV